ncbi:MAG: nucleotidyltransferase domain-containing protein [Myxococcales bacterium]|nr:nucleotidyltransferase domain-containing protein [Myxococcales bacterium]MCB9576218.1 nucleotidyltransferase domain-containing protein [Polyangiaceae bacterium]
MSFDPDRDTIFLTLAGSQAHGTAREGSDLDLRGVGIAPLGTRLSLFEDFEQYEGTLTRELSRVVLERLAARPAAREAARVRTECLIFDVAKLLRLCAAANPNALEILFADEEDWLVDSPEWRRIHAERHLFLTRKVEQTFSGYALAQLKRIETHRAWLLHPPAAKPNRADFGLPQSEGTLSRDDDNRIEQALAEKLRAYGVDDIEMPKATRIEIQGRLRELVADVVRAPDSEIEERLRAIASHALSLPRDVVTALNAEKRYRAAKKHWDAYQSWAAQRNRARADLEARHGYDTKHAMHLVRLMRMGLEVLRDGELRVRRPDADELNAIRDGALSFDELGRMAAELSAEMRRAAQASRLPAEADHAAVDRLALSSMTAARK